MSARGDWQFSLFVLLVLIGGLACQGLPEAGGGVDSLVEEVNGGIAFAKTLSSLDKKADSAPFTKDLKSLDEKAKDEDVEMPPISTEKGATSFTSDKDTTALQKDTSAAQGLAWWAGGLVFVVASATCLAPLVTGNSKHVASAAEMKA
jgi:hypothetical protein